MRKVIADIPICTNRHYNCVYVMLDSLLRFYGYDPILLCFHTWEFVYHRGKADRLGIWGMRTPLEKALRAFGVSCISREIDDLDQAWTEVKRLVDADIPVGTNIDVYPLAQAGRFPRLHHADHQFILSGYDEEQGTVHLVDPSPWQPAEMDIPFALFSAGWDTTMLQKAGERRRGRYQWFWVEVPLERPLLSVTHILYFLKQNLQAMSAKGDGANIAMGVEGIKVLADDVGEWTNDREESLRDRMARCFDFLQEIAVLREGYGIFLRRASERCSIPELSELSRDVERISQGWFVARNTFFRGSRRDPRGMVTRIRSRLVEIAEREEAAFVKLGEALQSYDSASMQQMEGPFAQSPEEIIRDCFGAWVDRDIDRVMSCLLETDLNSEELKGRIAGLKTKLSRLMTDNRHVKGIVEVDEPTYIDDFLAEVRVVVKTTESFPGPPDPKDANSRTVNLRLKRWFPDLMWRIQGGL